MAETPSLSLVKELKALENAVGRVFHSVLLLRKISAKTSSNGNTFLSLEFGDRTGTFSSTLFGDHPQFELVRGIGEGAAVRIEGKSDYYQGRLSPKISKI